MLSAVKLKELCRLRKVDTEQLADNLIRGGLSKKQAVAAVKNWQKGFLKPLPRKEDISKLATALSVEVNDLAEWCSSYRYAPGSARKARLVTEIIVGRSVQDAMDILKLTRKRAAKMVNQVLRCAVADADEQQADVDNKHADTLLKLVQAKTQPGGDEIEMESALEFLGLNEIDLDAVDDDDEDIEL